MMLEHQKLSPLWVKNRETRSVSCSLAFEQHEMVFRVKASGVYVSNNFCTKRVEGLWEGTVFELFLSSENYLEINLAPDGSWWDMYFTAPRTRADSVLDPATVKTRSMFSDNFLISELRCPIDSIKSCLGDDLCINFAAILREPTSYFSFVELPGDKPDFHQPQYFQRVSN